MPSHNHGIKVQALDIYRAAQLGSVILFFHFFATMTMKIFFLSENNVQCHKYIIC